MVSFDISACSLVSVLPVNNISMNLLQPWPVSKVSKTFRMTLWCMVLTQKHTTGDSTKPIEHLQECCLTLNAEKCLFNMDRVVFMGMLLSEKGIGPTADRVKAVLEVEEPKSASDVRSFLGLANYSSRFIPHFATLSEPLRRLTRKETPSEFGPEQKKSFECLKQKMAEACTLAYFDKNAPTKIITDASPVGLGAVLVQEQDSAWTLVCYASHSLTGCEQRYSQTEKCGRVRDTMSMCMR